MQVSEVTLAIQAVIHYLDAGAELISARDYHNQSTLLAS